MYDMPNPFHTCDPFGNYRASEFPKLLFFLTISGLLADLDLPDLGALVTDPTSALKFPIHVQIVENDIK